MKVIYSLGIMIALMLLSVIPANAQQQTGQSKNNQQSGFAYASSFSITRPLSELIAENPYQEPDFSAKPWISNDRKNRPAQTFVYSAEDGPEYGNDPAIVQTTMGKRKNVKDAPITNWAGVSSSAYPPDPSGAVGPNHYVQMVNATTVRIYNKVTGAAMSTFQLGTLWGSSSNEGDPIVMYDKFADRWFLAQFGTSTQIYIAVSQTSDPTGSYYTWTFNSTEFPDYLKFSIWQDGYYMTSNQTSDKIHVFERSAMLTGSSSARMTYATFSTGSVSGFYIPLPADAADDDALPASGTPLPFFSYYDNAWGGGNDAVKIWTATTSWGTTPSVSISGPVSVTTNSFDASYNSSWNDVPQPNGQYLDGIGGVLMYRAPWRSWSGYNSVVLSWGVLISNSPRVRAIYWCELRQTSGTWSMYQQGIYQPDSDTRWMSSAAMDDNGSIALCYAKSSTTTYPGLYYTGRLATDPLGTMTFAESTAIAGTSSQSSINRFGDYSQTSLDPDGLTFWHTGQYCATTSGQETRIYSFQLPAGTPTDVSNFNATAVSTSQIDLTWTLNSNSNPVMVAWNTTNSFGTPANGTAYSAGNTIAGGGTVLYYGTANNFSHTGLTPATTYYYKIWSNTGSYTWTTGVTDNATTFSSGNTSYPFTLDFESSADYTTDFSPWTTYDGDAQATYQSSDATFTGEGTAFAYLCMNPSLSGWTAAQGDAAHGGSRCGMAICPADASQSNDWFISPAMSLGTGSSFSLWVLSPKPSTWGNDSYQIMISTTDNQPASFTALSSLVEAPATWTQHTYSLSAYDNQTIYLAIRHVSTDMFMFWMDDLQFNSTISSSNAATIVSNPSSSSVCTGSSVTFTVSATGDAPITYQWQKNSANIAGATSSSYTIAAVGAGDVGAYRCIVTNAAGADTSSVANLTLSTAPSITTNPASATQCAGTNVTFTAAASGTATLTYQWKKDGSVIAGATNASYTISSITAGNAGSYTCVVTNSCGSATTTAAVLTVTPATAITTHPVSLNAYEGDNVTLTVVAAGSGLSYQWRKDGINLSDGGNISGSTTAALQITNVSPSDYGTYTCVVTGSCGSATSNGAVLTILTGVEDLEALRPDIYPNPSNGDFTIDLGQTPASGNYYVYDLDGKLLLWRMYKDATHILIDLNGRAQGTYLIRIDVNDKTFFDRLILKN